MIKNARRRIRKMTSAPSLQNLNLWRRQLKTILISSLCLVVLLTGCSSTLPNKLTEVKVGNYAPEVGFQPEVDRPKVSKWEEIPIMIHLDQRNQADLEQLAFPSVAGGYYAPSSFDKLYAVALPGTQYENNWYPSLQYAIEDPELGQIIANYDFQYVTTRQFESMQTGYIQYYGQTAKGVPYNVHMSSGYTHVYVSRDMCLVDLILETEDVQEVERFVTRLDTLLAGIPVPQETDKVCGYYLPTFCVEDIKIDLTTMPAGYIFWAFGNTGATMANVINLETGDNLQFVYREDVEDFQPNYDKWQLTMSDGYCYLQYRTASENVLSIMGTTLTSEQAAKDFIDTYVK